MHTYLTIFTGISNNTVALIITVHFKTFAMIETWIRKAGVNFNFTKRSLKSWLTFTLESRIHW